MKAVDQMAVCFRSWCFCSHTLLEIVSWTIQLQCFSYSNGKFTIFKVFFIWSHNYYSPHDRCCEHLPRKCSLIHEAFLFFFLFDRKVYCISLLHGEVLPNPCSITICSKLYLSFVALIQSINKIEISLISVFLKYFYSCLG